MTPRQAQVKATFVACNNNLLATARELGISRNTMYYYAKRLGLKGMGHRARIHDHDKIRALRASGMRPCDIARKLGISDCTVRTILRGEGSINEEKS